jgi:hypothetical protein
VFDGDAGANTYSIECDGAASTAPAASEVSTVVRHIDQNGNVTRS